MTAIVGIINRQGVAFAADSAATVTLSSTQKISSNYSAPPMGMSNRLTVVLQQELH